MTYAYRRDALDADKVKGFIEFCLKILPTSGFESCNISMTGLNNKKHKLTHLETGTGNPCAGHKSASEVFWG